MKISHIAFAAALGFCGSAQAVTCTTDTPVDSTVISDAGATIGGGDTYHAAGTANCPDQPGPAGPQGDKGDKGDKGDAGDQGPQGIQGVQGAQGDKGDKGDKGDTGAQGIQGVAGNDGAQGPKGDKGDKGDTGAQGDKGDKGDTGAQGIQGVKGDKGDTGAQGVAGKDGKDFDPSELERGLATIGALNVPHIDPGKHFGISGSAGFYNDEAAIGLGAAFRIDETWQLGGSVATDVGGKNVAGKGVLTGQW